MHPCARTVAKRGAVKNVTSCFRRCIIELRSERYLRVTPPLKTNRVFSLAAQRSAMKNRAVSFISAFFASLLLLLGTSAPAIATNSTVTSFVSKPKLDGCEVNIPHVHLRTSLKFTEYGGIATKPSVSCPTPRGLITIAIVYQYRNQGAWKDKIPNHGTKLTTGEYVRTLRAANSSWKCTSMMRTEWRAKVTVKIYGGGIIGGGVKTGTYTAQATDRLLTCGAL